MGSSHSKQTDLDQRPEPRTGDGDLRRPSSQEEGQKSSAFKEVDGGPGGSRVTKDDGDVVRPNHGKDIIEEETAAEAGGKELESGGSNGREEGESRNSGDDTIVAIPDTEAPSNLAEIATGDPGKRPWLLEFRSSSGFIQAVVAVAIFTVCAVIIFPSFLPSFFILILWGYRLLICG